MKQIFENILKNYLTQKETSFSNNQFIHKVKSDMHTIFSSANIDSDDYKISFSAGQGQWALIPWIALFDTSITKTATEGYYIVYLFRSDMTGFYLSLHQGWTYFKNRYTNKDSKNKIKLISETWRKILKSTNNKFSFDDIDLHAYSSSNTLAKGYELAHICGKFYSADNLPTNKEFIDDLRNLMSVYQELKGYMIDNSIEKTNNHILVNGEYNIIEDTHNDEEEINIDDILTENDLSVKLIKKPLPEKDKAPTIIKESSSSAKVIDYEKKNRKNTKIGFAGEKIVLEHEIKYLTKNNRKDLANKVEHVSKTRGDGLGYDVLSYDLDGKEKYIEVKTTTGPSNQSFYISRNELDFSEKNPENYHLYRLFDFNPISREVNFYHVSGDLKSFFDYEPINFIVNPKKQKY